MALYLRINLLTRLVKRQHYENKRQNGYVVLIPEIGEDSDKSSLLAKDGLPEFNDITIEKCIATIGSESLEYENGVKDIENSTKNCHNAFEVIFKPLEKLDKQLELPWGIAKTLYLGNSSLMPTKSYIEIHKRAHEASTSKFNSIPIYNAVIAEKNKPKKRTNEEERLLDKYILEGTLNGLNLSDIERQKLLLTRYDMQKPKEVFKFKVNLATKAFSSMINNPEIVREFPESLLKSMSVNNDPHKGPWKITLQPHIYKPFMEYCPDRILRWNTWQANVQRCSGYFDKDLYTSIQLEKIRGYREQQAKILGFKSYAEMSMETKMAGSVENVTQMLDTLLEIARPMQDVEMELLQKFAEERGFDSKLEYWDIPYWRRKQKWSLYNLNDEIIREYFPLTKVVNSLFNLCCTLFKIQIVERSNVHTWHKDVKFYDIYDESSNVPIAGFYLDPYAREDEKMHTYDDAGWHVSICNRSSITATNPLSSLIFNFQPPVDGKRSLLSFDEVAILFQRFGHALRHLLTKVNYSALAGLSNVEWDAAEICGFVMTHWLYEPNTIKAISGHYKTEEPLPDEVIINLQNVRQHMSGYSLCQELYLARLDLELHSQSKFWRDIAKELWPKYHSLPFHKLDSHPLTFTKIVSDEWSAAYYCHLWSRIIAADIYSAFEEARQENQDIINIGKKYRDTYLALGGSCHSNEIFRMFRGRDVSPHAFLRYLGLNKGSVKT